MIDYDFSLPRTYTAVPANSGFRNVEGGSKNLRFILTAFDATRLIKLWSALARVSVKIVAI